jgi:predicted nucleotidyltransferase
MLEPLPYSGNLPWVKDNAILVVNHGSVAYGTNTPASDLDIKGVTIPPASYFHGFMQKFEQAESKDPDMVIYDIRKFFALAADCNPNIIEVLFVENKDVRLVTDIGQILLDNRELFLSKKARWTFSGYAIAQLKRINTHYRWLKNPPFALPNREDFGLLNKTLIPQDQLSAAESMINRVLEEWRMDDFDNFDPGQRIAIKSTMAASLKEILKHTWDEEKGWTAAARKLGFSDNFIYLLAQEKAYKARKIEWDQYQTWKKNRNPARAALEEKYGFDCKFAMHLVRLMRMCKEILTTGKVIVKRPDREELLAIRNGAWTYEQLVSWSETVDKEMDLWYNSSTLPNSPDRPRLNNLCQKLVEMSL